MRKIVYSLLVVGVVVALVSCNNGETYGDKKNKERAAIEEFIRDSAITVINETQFAAQDSTTDVSKNEFVYLVRSGVYMQIVRKGCGKPLEDGKRVSVLCRYSEYNILDKAMQSRNDESPRNYDKMTVARSSDEYTASFESGVMKSTYSSASVPSGWLVPFQYINVGRQSSPDDEVAKVKLIVPHSQGQTYASQNVYPCYYVITYQKEK